MAVTKRAASKSSSPPPGTTKDEKEVKITGLTPRHFSLPESHQISLKTLRDAIPAHCFERSIVTSMSYVVWDFALVWALTYFAYKFLDGGALESGSKGMVDLGMPAALRWAVWAVWQFALGAVMFGIWILGHECGHNAFSTSQFVDNCIGLVLHSFVMVPFFSWQTSHRHHHHHTAHMTKDAVYIPTTRSTMFKQTGVERRDEKVKMDEPMYFENDEEYLQSPEEATGLFRETGPGRLIGLFAMWTVGWPIYMLTYRSGRNFGKYASHFNPYANIFSGSEFYKVIISDIGLLTVAALCGAAGYTWGANVVFRYYAMPIVWVYFWLSTITYLQHTDPSVPHYREEQWNFLRGALSTIDRDFGIFNHVFHRITDTHVVHHLFSTLPHYHAGEATEHVKKILQPVGLYHYSDENPVLAAWKAVERCRFVEDEGNVLFYRR